MRVVALISGGKDSCYNMMQCVSAGHTLVALANLMPEHTDEMDSYMYQTVGHQGIELIAEAMELPLFREFITGKAVDQERNYKPTCNDEVEDLFRLLAKVKSEMNIEAVAVGAILSDYQRIRVENVCQRLGLVALAYLWRRDQKALLQEMIYSQVDAIIIKVASLGLDPRIHLGMTLHNIQPHLLMMNSKYSLNVCGEGGEYETFTLDCPLFKKRLVVHDHELVIHSNDPVCPVGYLNLKLHLEAKPDLDGADASQMPPSCRTPIEFVTGFNDPRYGDIADHDISELEMEAIEKLEREQRQRNESMSYAAGRAYASAQDPDASDEESALTGTHIECERFPIADHRMIFCNKTGWVFVGGIVGEVHDTATAIDEALTKLIVLLKSEDLTLEDVCSVNIYMRDMGDYEELNRVYGSYFSFDNPPTRVVVQVPLAEETGLILDAVAHKRRSMTKASPYNPDRVTMHVRSISHWAPANIGPYSQGIKVGEVIGTCGLIALVPGSMEMLGGSARRECALALRHLTRVVHGAHSRAQMRSVVQSTCFMVSGATVQEARRQLERRTAGAIVQYAVVDALPRGAKVEWHAWAHTENNRFDYEETGQHVGEYKVAITRRWNYENNIAAFVCYVTTGNTGTYASTLTALGKRPSPSSDRLSFPTQAALLDHREVACRMTLQQLEQVFQYAMNKLLRDCRPPHVFSVRILYQVWSAPPPSRILLAMNTVRTQLCPGAVVTLVPVRALHNAYTFLTLSALRLNE